MIACADPANSHMSFLDYSPRGPRLHGDPLADSASEAPSPPGWTRVLEKLEH